LSRRGLPKLKSLPDVDATFGFAHWRGGRRGLGSRSLPQGPRTTVSANRTTNTRTLNRRRAVPHDNAETARLLAMVSALTSELAIVRERLDTHERLAAMGEVATAQAVEAYRPTPDDTGARDKMRNRLIGVVFRPLVDDAARDARDTAERLKRQEP
jgi:C4-dicarboxylate-specific signal transduction histidine kinase